MVRRAAVASALLTLALTTLAHGQEVAPASAPPESAVEPPAAAPAASTPDPQPPAAAPTPSPAPQPAPAPASEPVVRPEPIDPLAIPDVEEEPEPPRRRWYGWQTLIADGAVLGLLSAAAFSKEQSEPLAYAALLGYVVAAPAIHFAHGNPGRGFGSLGLRVGAPIVVGITSQAIVGCSGDFCGLEGVLYGALAALGVMGIDAGLIAWDDARGSARLVLPVIALDRDSTYFGARGAF